MIRKSRGQLALCSLLIGLLLAFIWGNSIMPGETSGQMSGWLGKLIGQIFPVFGPDNPNGSFLLRKCAHFSEFCALGMLLCWLWAMLRRRAFGWALGCGVAAAVIDETIQRFVPGRYGCIQDVLLDSCGVLTGICLVLAFFYFVGKWREQHGK